MDNRLAGWIVAGLLLSAIPALATLAESKTDAHTDSQVECFVPSKLDGTMNLTCKLAKNGLQRLPADMAKNPRILCLQGEFGTVAWHSLVSQRRAEPYGMIAVRADSTFKTLADPITALKHHRGKGLIGASGTICSQDLLKMALLAKHAGINPKVLRFVALEGGGESFIGMKGNCVQVVSGDASEAALYAGPGNTRVSAVMSEQRLPGVSAKVRTAREQGFDLVWPVIRGGWMDPQVADADCRKWVAIFDRMLGASEFAQTRVTYGLYPFSLTGGALTTYVKKTVGGYDKRAGELKLNDAGI